MKVKKPGRRVNIMKVSELREKLLPYLPEEAEWKKEYLAMLAVGKRPSCQIPDELPVFSDETVRGSDGTNYFRPAENVTVHRHWRYFPAAYHTHLFLEIMYLYDGSGTNFVEGVRTKMKTGDICIMSPKVYHIFEHDGDSVLMNIMVRTRYVEQIFAEGFRSDQGSVFASYMRSISSGASHPKCLYIHPNGDGELLSLADHLLCAYYDGSACVNEELCCWLRLLFARMMTSEQCLFQPSEMQYREKSPVMPILSYIYGCCTEVTLDGVAARFNYSKAYICRLLKENLGMTFSEYVAKLRMDRACELLAASELSVADIAEVVGYHSTEYFNRSFKSIMKMTPTMYRNMKGGVPVPSAT